MGLMGFWSTVASLGTGCEELLLVLKHVPKALRPSQDADPKP